MKNAIENLETILNAALSPAGINAACGQPGVLPGLIEALTIEKAIIIKAIKEEVFRLNKRGHIKLLISKYQLILISLADATSLKMADSQLCPGQHANLKAQSREAFGQAIACIDGLIIFLETEFNAYFNWGQNISEGHKLKAEANFKITAKQLVKHFRHIGIPVQSINLMMAPFHAFNKYAPNKKVTYQQIQYLSMLEASYKKFTGTGQLVSHQKEVLDFMVYLNFNDYYFVACYIGTITKDINTIDDVTTKIDRLSWWLKTISQIQVKPMVAYKPANTAAKEQLIGWLAEEVQFLQKKLQLPLSFSAAQNALPDINDKMPTSLSVKQLALFIRLFVDCGLIEPQNQTGMLTKVSGMMKTAKIGSISAQNLRAKYYAIEAPAKEIVKGYLFKMIDQLRSY